MQNIANGAQIAGNHKTTRIFKKPKDKLLYFPTINKILMKANKKDSRNFTNNPINLHLLQIQIILCWKFIPNNKFIQQQKQMPN